MNDTPDIDKKDLYLGTEMQDRALRKAEKEKKRKEEQSADKVAIEQSLSQSTLVQKKQNQKKQRLKWAGILTGVLFLTWAISGLFAPYKGDARFGICKVFLENSVRYPSHLRLSTVEDFGNSIRIWYAQTDAFGEYKLEQIQCFYKSDEQLGMILEKITFNRRPIDEQKVADFNLILPVVLQNLPDLSYPSPLPDSLEDLQIDADMFRRALNL